MANYVKFKQDDDKKGYVLISFDNYRLGGANGYDSLTKWLRTEGYLLPADALDEGLLADHEGHLYQWTPDVDHRLRRFGMTTMPIAAKVDDIPVRRRTQSDFFKAYNEWKSVRQFNKTNNN